MTGTYYETDTLSTAIFMLVLCGLICLALYILERNAKKEGKTVSCIACEKRGGIYPPINCPNCKCKFYDKKGM